MRHDYNAENVVKFMEDFVKEMDIQSPIEGV